ncbi:TonB C-terminal domain-containing protein [Helicobacter sp. 23-1044]
MDRFGSNYKDGIFVLSGVFSLSLYVLLLLLMALFFKLSSERINISINAKSAIQSISVNLVEVPLKQQNAESQSPKITEQIAPKSENKPKESGSKSAISGLGASDLFSKIDTKKPSQNLNEIQSDRDKIALNKKGENPANDALNKILQSTQNIEKTLQNLNSNIMITDSTASKFCEKHGDYCKKLTEILYKSWNAKSAFDEVLSSIVQISISKDGNFSYTIKKKSGNATFDSELAHSLQNLTTQKVPVLENVRIDKLEVNFTNKGRME